MSFFLSPNRYLDNQSCDVCRFCYRSQDENCRQACRRCGISMFSEDTTNLYYNSPPRVLYPYFVEGYENVINKNNNGGIFEWFKKIFQ